MSTMSFYGRAMMSLTIVLACLAFMFGCQDHSAGSDVTGAAIGGQMLVASSDGESAAALPEDRPGFTKTLPEGTAITVHSADILYERLHIRYDYVTPEGETVERQMFYMPDYTGFTIHDLDGHLLAGCTTEKTQLTQAFTIYTSQVALRINLSPDDDGFVEYKLADRVTGTEAVWFENYDQLERAIQLYLGVENGKLRRETFTRDQDSLYSRVAEIASWQGRLDGAFNLHDICSGIELAGDLEFQAWLQSDPDRGVPDVVVKILRIICRGVKAMQYICRVLGGSELCAWVEAADVICDIIFEEILDMERP